MAGEERARKGRRWTKLHIPLFFGNKRPVILRDHVISYVQLLGVILESKCPFVVGFSAGFALIHREVRPLGVLLVLVGTGPVFPFHSGAIVIFVLVAVAAQRAGFFLVVRIVRILKILGHGWVMLRDSRLAVPVAVDVLLGAVVALESVSPVTEHHKDDHGHHYDQRGSAHHAPNHGGGDGRMRHGCARWRRGVGEFWVGKDRWKGEQASVCEEWQTHAFRLKNNNNNFKKSGEMRRRKRGGKAREGGRKCLPMEALIGLFVLSFCGQRKLGLPHSPLWKCG